MRDARSPVRPSARPARWTLFSSFSLAGRPVKRGPHGSKRSSSSSSNRSAAAVSYARLRSAGRPAHVFWTSVAVFLVLNVVENLVHYSIGRRRKRQQQEEEEGWWPTPRDAASIAAVMLVFAALQGVMTRALLG